jgi:hypothetical protein
MIRLPLAMVLTLTLTGCAPTRSTVRTDASVRVECSVGAARVYINDAFVGRAAELERRTVPVASGNLRVEARADGYFTAYHDVAVPSGGAARVQLELHRVPENEPGG